MLAAHQMASGRATFARSADEALRRPAKVSRAFGGRAVLCSAHLRRQGVRVTRPEKPDRFAYLIQAPVW
jgi:hypothetical protein